MKIIRFGTAIGERIAPDLTGWCAFWMFCRTPKPDLSSPGQARAMERAAELMAKSAFRQLEAGGKQIAAYEFQPHQNDTARGTVLVLHGWNSRTEHMIGVIGAMRDLGFRVVALDLPGLGRSSGRSLSLASAVEACHTADKELGPFDAIVGHSLGGAVAINAVAGTMRDVPSVRVRRLVTISAPNALSDLFKMVGERLGLGPASQAGLEAAVERVGGNPLETYVNANLLRQVGVPTLVIHDRGDKEVPPADAEALASAGRDVEILWTEKLGHRRILNDQSVLDNAVAFLSKIRLSRAA